MEKRNDSFPFMTDNEVKLYWEAMHLTECELSEDQKKALRQNANEADLLTLWDLMERLRDGLQVSNRLSKKLEALYRVMDAEGLTA